MISPSQRRKYKSGSHAAERFIITMTEIWPLDRKMSHLGFVYTKTGDYPVRVVSMHVCVCASVFDRLTCAKSFI